MLDSVSGVNVLGRTSSSHSAASILAHLSEDDDALKLAALKVLYQIVEHHWPEICNYLPTIEEISEESNFEGHELAAAIASKCFFHLQEYNESFRLALGAGKYFNLDEKTDYVDNLLATCIAQYIQLKKQVESGEQIEIDPRMESIIEQMFQRCYNDNCIEQAIGVAIDARRIDKIQEICDLALKLNREDIIGYIFNVCQGSRNIRHRDFRLEVLNVLVSTFKQLAEPDFSSLCHCLQSLNRPSDVSIVLNSLCAKDEEHALRAYQIAFDLQEAENQGFILRVVEGFTQLHDIDNAQAAADDVNEYRLRLRKLRKILVEGFDVDLILNFLFKQCKTDYHVLNILRGATDAKMGVAALHNAAVVAHGFMNSGTTIDNFLRMNLEWLGKASNWAKFTAVASIGVVNKGHVHESMKLLEPYLPKQGMSASSFSESGALYALGLIHANKGGAGDAKTISYLSDALRNSGTNDVVQHGATLGLGLAAMGTGDEALFENMKGTLFTDSALAGEGSAFGIGLLMLGQSDSNLAQSVIPDLLNYLHDTEHEKIVRALSLAIAMMVYGKEDNAEPLIEQMARDRDAIVRYSSCFAVALAFCGTGDNASIKRLLHVAVSDVNDDVRRAAVMCLGFVLCQKPEIVPNLVALLAESFNPHVRYGACLAIGIACAGTALKSAIDLLFPLTEDSIDFVRQGAYIALSMVLMQISEARSPAVKKLKELLTSVITDKHQTVLSKTGAALAFGILEAGGRNVVISLSSRAGFMKMASVVGMVMFLQYWFWYPLELFLSLSFAPTMLIGLNKDFNVPLNFNVKCNAPPSMFAYPKTEERKEGKKEKVVTAVLSTTMRTKAREARKEAKKLGRQPSKDTLSANPLTRSTSMENQALERVHSHLSTTSFLSVEERQTEPPEEIKKKEKEPSFFVLSNPDRLIPSQVRFISVIPNQRYVPVNRRVTRPAGIVVLSDSDPAAPEEVTTVERVLLGQEDEASPPESFIWRPESS